MKTQYQQKERRSLLLCWWPLLLEGWIRNQEGISFVAMPDFCRLSQASFLVLWPQLPSARCRWRHSGDSSFKGVCCCTSARPGLWEACQDMHSKCISSIQPPGIAGRTKTSEREILTSSVRWFPVKPGRSLCIRRREWCGLWFQFSSVGFLVRKEDPMMIQWFAQWGSKIDR